MRESSSYMEIARAMRERDKLVPAVPSWMVLDSQYLDKYMLAGTMPGAKKPKPWFDEQFLRRGDTLDGTGAPPATWILPDCRHSVERFNGFVRKGRDEDFHRGDHVYDHWLGDSLHQPRRRSAP